MLLRKTEAKKLVQGFLDTTGGAIVERKVQRSLGRKMAGGEGLEIMQGGWKIGEGNPGVINQFEEFQAAGDAFAVTTGRGRFAQAGEFAVGQFHQRDRKRGNATHVAATGDSPSVGKLEIKATEMEPHGETRAEKRPGINSRVAPVAG